LITVPLQGPAKAGPAVPSLTTGGVEGVGVLGGSVGGADVFVGPTVGGLVETVPGAWVGFGRFEGRIPEPAGLFAAVSRDLSADAAFL
jgi:biotin transporter BioY